MLILQTFVFFFALILTINGFLQFIANCVNILAKLIKVNTYINVEWNLILSSILWSLLFYLKS